MNRYTLFGEFVIGLKEHLAGHRGRSLGKEQLVYEITGQDDCSQQSRYMRMYRASDELFVYHKSTISQIIAHSYAYHDPDSRLVSRIGRGYKLIGKVDDAYTIDSLATAIDSVRGPVLDLALSERPIRPDSDFCRKMCQLYGESYGGQGGVPADLENYIRAIDAGYDTKTMTREIYKRILLAILLGPEAMPTIARESGTARMTGSSSAKVIDAFSLTQMANQDGEVLPVSTLCFDLGRDIVIGRPGNECANYTPLFGKVKTIYMSFDHAAILWTPEKDGAPAWTLVNHSQSNGTAVHHVNGATWFSMQAGECERLHPGDELWMPPSRIDGKCMPEYDCGSVVRFDCLYSNARRTQRSHGADIASKRTAQSQSPRASTSFLEGPPRMRKRTRRVIGFALGDLVGTRGYTAYRLSELADESGYFSLSIGRLGEYATESLTGSTVSKIHAYIETQDNDQRLLLTNRDENPVVVWHADDTFDELTEWMSIPILDGDRIYLAGKIGKSGPYADANGSVISFKYLYRID